MTTLSSLHNSVPRRVVCPAVYFRESWTDAWELAADWYCVSLAMRIAGQDMSECRLMRNYGLVREPFERRYSQKIPDDDKSGWFVNIRWLTDAGEYDAFTGIVDGPALSIDGSTAHGRSGVQQIAAYGGEYILHRIDVSTAMSDDGRGTTIEIGRTISFNDRRRAGLGNMAIGDATGNTFGGIIYWDNRSAIEYLLARYADAYPTGPSWVLTGTAEALAVLESRTDTVKHDKTRTVFALIRDLVPLAAGIDFKIVRTSTGFAVRVFSLAPEETSFSGITFPAASETLDIEVGSGHDHDSVTIAASGANRYGRVRVVGERCVSCFSVTGWPASWPAALEAEYLAGTGTAGDTAEQHDAARADARFESVFQHLRIPADWNLQSGAVCPAIDESGEIVAATPAPQQLADRATLPWIPMYDGVDYAEASPASPADGAELMRPLVYVDGTTGMQPVDRLGVGVAVPSDEWGINLSANPNHLFASDDWTGAAATKKTPLYDYYFVSATIAIELDQRLSIESGIPGADPSHGVKTIEVPGAHWWYVSPGTVCGIDRDPSDGNMILRYRGATGYIVRNDAQRLLEVMAGYIARYIASRVRIDGSFIGSRDWGQYLGYMVTGINDGDAQYTAGGVLSAVEWDFTGELPRTRIRGGYAQ